MSMDSYMEELKDLPMTRERRKQLCEKASESKITQFRSLAGTLLWLGKDVLPPAAYASSAMQQRLSLLKVAHLVEANEMFREIKNLEPVIIFRRNEGIVQVLLTTFQMRPSISARGNHMVKPV